MNRIALVSALSAVVLGASLASSEPAAAASRRVVHADADGATSSGTGNGATTTASYNKDTGRTRTTSCFDASGATIACPSRP